jgi:hypothetical protein
VRLDPPHFAAPPGSKLAHEIDMPCEVIRRTGDVDPENLGLQLREVDGQAHHAAMADPIVRGQCSQEMCPSA